MNLSSRIFLIIFIPLVILGITFGFFIVQDFNNDKKFKDQQLRGFAESIERRIMQVDDDFGTILNLIINSGDFEDNLREQDFEQLFIPVSTVYEINGHNTWVLSESFEVLARGHNEFKFGDIMESLKFPAGKLTIKNVEGNLQFLKRKRVDLNFGRFGSIVIGNNLDQQFIKQFDKNNYFDWNLIYGETSMLSSCGTRCSFDNTSTPQEIQIDYRNLKMKFQIAHRQDYIKFYSERLITLIVLLLAILGVAIFLSRKIVDKYLAVPLAGLIRKMENYENASSIEAPSGGIEFKRLNKAFNLMLDDISSKKSLIEEKVTELKDQKKRLDMENNLMKVLCHDISNPITSIDMALILIKKNRFEQAIEKNLTRIDNSNKTIKNIVTHVREMKAIESGRKKLHLVPASLDEIIAYADEIFQEKLAKKNLSIVLEDRRKGLDIHFQAMVEPISFQNSVVNNILNNAIKFSNFGEIITLRIEKLDDHLAISIINTGPPLPKEKERKIFVFDGETSSLGTAGEHGTGFGMPVAKTYMEFYGGEISATSIGGKTYFILQFPLIKQEQGLKAV